MSNYRLTRRAEEGLERIAEYVAREFGARVLERVLDDLESAFEFLAASPRIGHLRPDLTDDDDIRFWSVSPTLVAYRIRDLELQVLIIEREARDWSALLDEEDPSES